MEALILLGVIVFIFMKLSNDDCEHNWIPDNSTHTCSKCGKSEGHNYEVITHDAWADENIDTYTVLGCSICGCDHSIDND